MVVDAGTVMQVSVAVAIATCAAALIEGPGGESRARPMLLGALFGVVSGLFMYVYAEFTRIPDLPFIRPSIAVPAARLACGALGVAAMLALAHSSARERLSSRGHVVAMAALVVTLWAYFDIDAFSGMPARSVQAAAVLAGVVGIALVSRRCVRGHVSLGAVTMAAVLALSLSHFAYAYLGDRTDLPVPELEQRTSRVAFETAIARAAGRSISAVYLGSLGPFARHQWTFYALKHERSDLVERGIPMPDLTQERVQNLPAGSLAIIPRSPTIDEAVDRMSTGGEVKAESIAIPGGPPLFWVLDRSG
jgi:hypothetical protein